MTGWPGWESINWVLILPDELAVLGGIQKFEAAGKSRSVNGGGQEEVILVILSILNILGEKSVIFHFMIDQVNGERERELGYIQYSSHPQSVKKENKTSKATKDTTPKLPCYPKIHVKPQPAESIFSSQIFPLPRSVLKEKQAIVYIVLYPTPSKSI